MLVTIRYLKPFVRNEKKMDSSGHLSHEIMSEKGRYRTESD